MNASDLSKQLQLDQIDTDLSPLVSYTSKTLNNQGMSPGMEVTRELNNNVSMLSKRSSKQLVGQQLQQEQSQFIRMQVEQIAERHILENGD